LCHAGSSATRTANVAGSNPSYVNDRSRQHNDSNCSTASTDTMNEDNQFVTSAGLKYIPTTSEAELSTTAAPTTVASSSTDDDDDESSRSGTTHSTTDDKHQVILYNNFRVNQVNINTCM